MAYSYSSNWSIVIGVIIRLPYHHLHFLSRSSIFQYVLHILQHAPYSLFTLYDCHMQFQFQHIMSVWLYLRDGGIQMVTHTDIYTDTHTHTHTHTHE